MSRFEVAPECLDLGMRAGAIIFRDVTIGESSTRLREEIDEAAQQMMVEFPDAASVRAIPEIATLQQILRAVGVKPKSHPPSTQKLIDFARKRGTLHTINNLVDTYNLISIRSKCSLGAHDLDQILTPVRLQLFTGNESFRPLGNSDPTAVKPGEFGYVDADDRVLCRLDSLQAEFSKVTSSTKNVILIVETTTIHTAEFLQSVFETTVATVTRECGGIAEVVSFP